MWPISCTQTMTSVRSAGFYAIDATKLDEGQIEKLVGYLRSLLPASPELKEIIHKEADYLQRNAQRMRYPEFASLCRLRSD